MPRFTRYLLPLLLATVSAAFAQNPTPGSSTPGASVPTRPARRAEAGPTLSPEVTPDRHVTFRLRAPNAKNVSVSGQFQSGAVKMTKDEADVWSATVGPVAPGIYEYSFNVDGLQMIDPGNREIKPMRAPRTSILEISGNPPLIAEFQDVPHGRVTLHWYRSKTLNRVRGMQVYTPPGYDANPSMRYPVLYLQHGSGDNEATWVAHGKAHWILDNLIAQQRAKPMIIVMLDGHAVAPGTDAARTSNTALFERDLLDDAMPLVVASYRTREDAASRAIIGLSMGGGQSLTIGLKHPDLFAWVGGMSSSVRNGSELIQDPAGLNRQLKLLWFACGKDDQLVKANREFDTALTQAGVKHEFIVSEGAHAWPVWRRYLEEFLPKLF